jgi:hypothetical protein
MVWVDNYITKMLDTHKCYVILTYFDFNTVLTKEMVRSYLATLVEQNPILTKVIQQDQWVCGERPFVLETHYTIRNLPCNKLPAYTNHLLNTPISQQSRWNAVLVRDLEKKSSRLYFKIEHSYCDGYKLIEMLTKVISPNYTPPKFKRKWCSLATTLYYWILGTLYLYVMNLVWILSHFLIKHQSQRSKVDYSIGQKRINLFCGELALDRLKQISRANQVTVNTVLYALMVKTWYYYTKSTDSNILGACPIRVTPATAGAWGRVAGSNNVYHANNMFFIFLEIEHDPDNKMLLRKVEELFNLYKHSFYVPIANHLLSVFFPFIPREISNQLFHEMYGILDFNYTNIIGPTIETATRLEDSSLDNVSRDRCRPTISHCEITNIQFTTVTNSNEACCNIISYQNNVNVNLSFRKGIIKRPSRYVRAFERAREELGIAGERSLITG